MRLALVRCYAHRPARRAITPRTKMIIINTPHNPVGKVFTREELEKIAALAEQHNLLVMSDEVVSAPRASRRRSNQVDMMPSTTSWCSTTRNTCGSRLSLACGIAPSRSAPRAVSVIPLHATR